MKHRVGPPLVQRKKKKRVLQLVKIVSYKLYAQTCQSRYASRGPIVLAGMRSPHATCALRIYIRLGVPKIGVRENGHNMIAISNFIFTSQVCRSEIVKSTTKQIY